MEVSIFWECDYIRGEQLDHCSRTVIKDDFQSVLRTAYSLRFCFVSCVTSQNVNINSKF